MYIVTFYSYKGGVGRTMALANVSYALAKAKKRVLVVDFDLEAPGLPSYLDNKTGQGGLGVVDYVHLYMNTSTAPDVREFITQAKIGDEQVWFMPAGQHTNAGYSARLNEIDWGRLYAEREGFLLMEDMKRQWEQYENVGFDYVLLDSRTGHTDVGGICTRQLPDAVVVLFVPTPQNISGLIPIVRTIAQERAPVREDRVQIHFCPSNLPDLDDEEDILKDLLNGARERLKYRKPAATVQHYRSLDLLQHPIYTFSKPNSRLAKQYNELFEAVIAGNLADKDGALSALRSMVDDYSAAREENDVQALTSINTNVTIIRANFPDDAEVAWQLAALANLMMRPEDELSALNTVISSGAEPRFARLQRARVLASLGDRQQALTDLEKLLVEGAVTFFEVIPAVESLRTLDADRWSSIAEKALGNAHIDARSKAILLQRLLETRAAADNVVDLAERVLSENRGSEHRDAVVTACTLALIAARRFHEAMAILGDDPAPLVSAKRMVSVFNYAVADWGATGSPSLELFRNVLALSEGSKAAPDANMLQCLGLCHMAVGDWHRAAGQLKSAAAIVEAEDWEFSCWRYLQIPGSEMLKDIEAMSRIALARGDPTPPFFRV